VELLLKAWRRTAASTISKLEIDGTPECYVLEDTVREVPGEPVASWKVHGETAIPSGRYRVILTQSARFGRILPLLEGVEGYEGIRIHPGNTAADTDGCLLPGLSAGEDCVNHSRDAFEALFEKIEAAISAGDEVWITIDRKCSE